MAITKKQFKSSRKRSNKWGKLMRQRLQSFGYQNKPWWMV